MANCSVKYEDTRAGVVLFGHGLFTAAVGRRINIPFFIAEYDGSFPSNEATTVQFTSFPNSIMAAATSGPEVDECRLCM